MSRIGRSPVRLPEGVKVTTSEEGLVSVEGSRGVLERQVSPGVELRIKPGTVSLNEGLSRPLCKAFHGLDRSLLSNMTVGVSEGYRKTLELVGVGYKAGIQNNVLELSLGYSHGIFFALPREVVASTETVKGKNPLIHLEGIDKQLVGQVAAKLKELRKVEPYKGKGIRFLGEKIRRKVGKSASR